MTARYTIATLEAGWWVSYAYRDGRKVATCSSRDSAEDAEKAAAQWAGVALDAKRRGGACAIFALALLLGACSSGPPQRLTELYRLGWVEHGYDLRAEDDWRPSWDGDCRSKTLAAMSVLQAEGWAVDALVGCRTDMSGIVDGQCDPALLAVHSETPLHMAPVACSSGECWVIDLDGVWRAENYPMVAYRGYDWRMAAAAAGGGWRDE